MTTPHRRLAARNGDLTDDEWAHAAPLIPLAKPGRNKRTVGAAWLRRTAQSLKLELHQFEVREPTEFASAFVAMVEKRVGHWWSSRCNVDRNAPTIARLASEHRLPASGWPDFAAAGGLMASGVNYVHVFRGAATFIDKIRKGTNPSEIPVERYQVRNSRQPQDR